MRNPKSAIFVLFSILLLIAGGFVSEVFSQDPFGRPELKKPPKTSETKKRKRQAATSTVHASRKGPDTSITAQPDKPTPDPQPLAPDERARAIESFQKEDFEKSVELLNQVIAKNPKDAELMYYLGDAYSKIGKHSAEAKKAYEDAINLDPKNATPGTYYNLGLACEDLKLNDLAIQRYNEAISRNPEYVDAYLSLGDVYSSQNGHSQAFENYEKAFRLKTTIDDPVAFFNAGLAASRMAKKEKAIEWLVKAIELKFDPLSEAYYNLGLVYFDSGESEKAIDAFNTQLRLKSDDERAAWAYGRLGELYDDKKKIAEAIDAYSHAVALSPDDMDSWRNLASLYLSTRPKPLYAEAIQSASQILKNIPAGQEANYLQSIYTSYFVRGRAMLGQGNYQEAYDALKQAKTYVTQIKVQPGDISRAGDTSYYFGVACFKLNKMDEARSALVEAIQKGLSAPRLEIASHDYLLQVYVASNNQTGIADECKLIADKSWPINNSKCAAVPK
jgi:tetratricopeptide (TPR) repeat protein